MTIVFHQTVHPLTRESYFYINDTNELSQIPQCLVDSKVLNLTNGDLWVLSESATTVGKIVWHKWKSATEVNVSWK